MKSYSDKSRLKTATKLDLNCFKCSFGWKNCGNLDNLLKK